MKQSSNATLGRFQNGLAHFGTKYLTPTVLTSVYLMLASALFVAMVPRFGFVSVALMFTSLLAIATLPGAALVRHIFPRPGLFQIAIIGTTLGLGLLAIGGLISQITGVFEARWIPSAFALLLWAVPKRAKKAEVEAHPSFPKLGILGSLAALATLLPSLWTALKVQRTAWDGWYQLHHDLTFQMALVGEVSSRIPTEFPWIGETLSYPWLFHSAMGVWASTAGATAGSIVLNAWPILYVGLMPAIISVTAWHLTRRSEVAFAAPVVFTLVHGLVFGVGLSQQYPLFQVSPTRDFAHLFMLLAVLSLYRLLAPGKIQPFNWWWLTVLCLSAFVTTGAKSSSLPLILGAVVGAICVLVASRLWHWSHFAVLFALVTSSVLAFLVVTPVRGHNDAVIIAPLSFTHDPTVDLPSAAMSVGVLLVAILGMWFLLGKSSSENWLAASFTVGVCLAGLAGVALLGHPGLSQLYFWQGAQPLFVIGLAWAGSLLFREHGWRAAIGALMIFVVGHLLWALFPIPWLVAMSVLLMALVTALVLHRAGLEKSTMLHWRLPMWASIAATAAFLSLAPQVIQIPKAYVGGSVADSSTPGAIHASQLEAYEFIRANSGKYDKIISNKHCYNGTLESSDCDGRWFAAAAFAERRVQIEGWAYTPKGPDSVWVRDRIVINDEFITNPSLSGTRELLEDGVMFVFVDKREPFSPDLGSFGSLEYEGEWALVYSLGASR